MPKIKHDKLKTLLTQSGDTIERQPDCPDDYHLASYMEGGLSERDHIHFESHLADCAFCMERVGILGRAGESESADVVPQHIQTVSDKPAWSRRAPRWATAAVVVLAVGFIADRLSSGRVSSVPEESLSPTVVSERSIEAVSPFPEILSPLEGSLVDPEQFVFRWKEVPGSLFYDIRIVSDDGAQIARQRVWDTQWSLTPETPLQAGAEYFVRVDAFVSEGKAVSSEHTVFVAGSR